MLPTLHSERLTLRPWVPADEAAVLDLYSRWEVVRFLGAHPTVITEPAEAAARIARWSSFAGPLHGVWAIVPDAEDRPIGTALLKLLPHSGTGMPSDDTEVGWHLHPDAWGNGYATEAGRRLLEHAWAHDLERVFAVTYPDNAASRAVCRRLGMTGMGLTDRYYDLNCELYRADRAAT
ncbi:MAG: GNAT family N-acetyltransferase [Propionicimonas sp.]